MVASAERRQVKLVETEIVDCLILESGVFGDDRGLFREWFKLSDLAATGRHFGVEQANFSVSSHNVVRGLHYSVAPRGQAKLVTCAQGTLDDVIVDIRVGSPTFGQVVVVSLAADQGRSVLLPEGVAHGFCVTSEVGALAYLLSTPYDAPNELEIHPFDEELGVAWPLTGDPILSAKDAAAPSFRARLEAGQLPVYTSK
jgi:dTDP-4-dehydrorhamnose 3,5-epimerase